MLNRVRNAFYNVVGGYEPLPGQAITETVSWENPTIALNQALNKVRDIRTQLPLKYPYSRPHFLQFSSEDEVQVSGDHALRPIIVPRDNTRIPWKTGYAEAVNAGKSQRNEDQAAVYFLNLRKPETEQDNTIPENPSILTDRTQAVENTLPCIYIGIFDGHAGTGAAIAAANVLHIIIQKKLESVLEYLLPTGSTTVNGESDKSAKSPMSSLSIYPHQDITVDSLIIGALESAFWQMDQQIARDRLVYKITGGCTALVALFILGKLYISNAGDSRAIVVKDGEVVPMSNDFTPETEKLRIKRLALCQPDLLGDEYTSKEFIRRPNRKDIGKKLLYRDAHMTGWSIKTVTPDDLKYPVICGEGKRSRVLATIGVTRGFGDHDLTAHSSNIKIKPFLSPQPEVRVLDLCDTDVTDNDVLIMGTDGLWDITSNEKAAEIIQKSLEHFPAEDQSRYCYRYTAAAQDLVMHSRGKLKDRSWKTVDNKCATIDDITVFVIPLLEYKKEYLEWKKNYDDLLLKSITTEMASDEASQNSVNEVFKSPTLKHI